MSARLNLAGYRTKQADEDADVLIVQTALENSNYEENVIIVGNDTDLLIILSQLAGEKSNIFFHKISNSKNQNQYFTTKSFKFPELQKIIAFLYIFTGCDTTSAFFGIGKSSILNLDSKMLTDLASCYYEKSCDKLEICVNGKKIIKEIYSTKIYKNLEKNLKRNFLWMTFDTLNLKGQQRKHHSNSKDCHRQKEQLMNIA